MFLFSCRTSASCFEINWPDYQKKLLVSEPLLTQYYSTNANNCKKYQHLLKDLADGDSLFIAGEPEMAGNFYKKGLIVSTELNLTWHQIIFYNRLGFSNYWNENLVAAINNYSKSYDLITNSKSIKDTLAAFETISFRIMYMDKPPCPNKGVDCKYSIDRLIRIDKNDRPRSSKYFLLLAEYYLDKDDVQEARENFEAAENYSPINNPGSEFWLLLIHYNKALYYRYITDYKLSQEFLEALKVQITNNPRFKFMYFNVCLNLGEDLNYLNLWDSSRNILEAIQPLVNSKQYAHHYEYYLWLGNTYQYLGKMQIAQEWFYKASNILKSEKVNDFDKLRFYVFMALFYYTGMLNPDLELKYLKLAEKIISKYPDNKYYNCYVAGCLGRHYYKSGNYKKALECFNPYLGDVDSVLSSDKVFYSRLGNFSSQDYQFMLWFRSNTLQSIARKNNYDLKLLLKSYKDIKDEVRINTRINKDHPYEKSKLDDMSLLKGGYDEILIHGYEIIDHYKNDSIKNELFEYSEKSKAAILKNYVTEEMAKKKAGIPEEIIHQSTEIKKGLDTLQYALIQQQGQYREKTDNIIISKILIKENEYKNLEKKLEEEYPEYKKIKYSDNKISIANLQANLLPSQAVLEYQITSISSCIFYIDKYNYKVIYTPASDQLSDTILAYRSLINNVQNGNITNQQFQKFLDQSFVLYHKLIEPVESLIINKHLIIVPDQELNLIPFETLLTAKYDTTKTPNDYSRLSYLIMKNPISYVYSVSQLLNQQVKEKKKIRFAGFAPDYKDVSFGKTIHNPVDPALYSQLPGANEEVLSARKFYKGKLFLGKDATKENFFHAASRSDIVHLAMHTFLDKDEPMNSELIFSPDLSRNDKQLHAFEVYSNKITADLIVLSGCNTGNGQLTSGEGVYSIARAFLLAGVKNIIITQWSVADRSSAFLMSRFYEYLSKGNPVDIALQKAKIDCITKGDPLKAHPYYWAGYVCLGNPQILVSEQGYWLYIIIGGLVVLILLYCYIKFKT